MRALKIAVLAATMSVIGFGFASPASACKNPVNNNDSCEWGGCHMVWSPPDPADPTAPWAAPYWECYY